MKILLLTFYFPPDLSAGAYRSGALVKALLGADAGTVEVDVLTTAPNRYASYPADPGEMPVTTEASVPGLQVERIEIAQHRSGLLDQAFSFGGFAFEARRRVRGRRYDIVIATSSRLFTGWLGALLARGTGARFYLDVRDLFVDTIGDLFPGMATRVLAPLLSRLERFTFRRADRINLVSPGFLEYCSNRYPDREFARFSNGIDPEFVTGDFGKRQPARRKIILYAGNIGLGQALETVVPEAAVRLGPDHEIRVIGDGGRRKVLEARVQQAGLDNVVLLPPMGRSELLVQYREADYLLLHLNDAPAMRKVLPSKLFEYAATGKPILAGVAGYARDFIDAELRGVAVFAPGDADGLIAALNSLPQETWNRSDFKERFARDRIMARMAEDILTTARPDT